MSYQSWAGGARGVLIDMVDRELMTREIVKIARTKKLCKRYLHNTMMARIEMSPKESAREDEDTPSFKIGN